MSLDSPEIQALLGSDQEEAAPFPGARRILHWEQRMVSALSAQAGIEQTHGLYGCCQLCKPKTMFA